MIGEPPSCASAQTGVANSPVGKKLFGRYAVESEVDRHRIRLGILGQNVMRSECSSAVLPALDIDDRAIAGHVQLAARICQLVHIGGNLRHCGGWGAEVVEKGLKRFSIGLREGFAIVVSRDRQDLAWISHVRTIKLVTI